MNEFNIADVAIIVFLTVCTYFYYHRGLVHTLLGFFTTLISVVLSGILSPLLANILMNTSISESIKEYVGKTLLNSENGTVESLIRDLSVPEFLRTNLIDNMDVKSSLANSIDYISEYITIFIIKIISMIIVFLLLFVIFKVIANTLNIISRLPVLRTANKIGGGVLGFAEGILIIWIVFAVLTMLYGKPMFSAINESISHSMIASKLYDSNILIKGFSDFMIQIH